MKASEQASAEYLLAGFVVVCGHVRFHILLPVVGLHVVGTIIQRRISEYKVNPQPQKIDKINLEIWRSKQTFIQSGLD